MAIWHISGGKRLEGACFVQGSKNAALPILAASVLTPAVTELINVPRLSDVDASLRILRQLGCVAEQRDNDVYIDSSAVTSCEIPREMMETMRSSVLFMGALLARCGEVRLTRPGGCKLGERPVDMHLSALEALGAEVEEDGCTIVCRANRLCGSVINLPYPSVGATENAMIAACAAEGTTTITGAAREPEIVDLQEYLRKLGAYISGAGTSKITICGFAAERHVGHRVMPDRIAASTFLCAAAAAGGDIELRGVDPSQFSPVRHFLNAAGCDIISGKRSVRLTSDGKLSSRQDRYRALSGISDRRTAVAYGGAPACLRQNGVQRNRFRQALCSHSRACTLRCGHNSKRQGSSALGRAKSFRCRSVGNRPAGRRRCRHRCIVGGGREHDNRRRTYSPRL